ncbi:hypothetical protein CFC21_105477, partial [Triticum aestivum]
MDEVESSSPHSPPSLRHKLRTTVCGCFGSPSSPGSGGEEPKSGGRARWRGRVAAAGSSDTTRSATRSTTTTAAATAAPKRRTPPSGTETSTPVCLHRRCRPPEPSPSP